MIEVREARIEELGRVLGMYEWLFAPPGLKPPNWDAERGGLTLREAIDAERSTVLVAVDDEELIGLCTAYIDLNSVRFGRRCWVEDLAVDPKRRSEGVGGRLLGAAKQWARERGATHLELDSGEARTDAQRFYERERPSWRSLSYAWEL